MPPQHDALRGVLAAAVEELGGSERPGQVQMAEAVTSAMVERRHLLVQAGTGTGKSLGYLVPALLHDRRVVVATATLALQHQLVERDLPRLVEAVKDSDGIDTSYAVLKGRSNYACLHRIREGVPDDQGVLVDVPAGVDGKQGAGAARVGRAEAKDNGSGERDTAPRHTDREWRQVSVSHRDCLGATRCPFGQECFAEGAREKAHRSHLIVTNHSLLAIDAIEGVPMIPEYDVVVIDEAHELVARVTQAATDELFAADVERAARRSQRHVEGEQADDLADAGEALRDAIGNADPGRFDAIPQQLADALILVRDAARACLSAYPKQSSEGEADAGMTQAKGAVQEVFMVVERMAADAESDVLWLTEGGDRLPPRLCVAPLEVWGPMREKLLSDKTAILTSATLMLGGDFSSWRPASACGRPSAPASGWSRSPVTRLCRGSASTSAARSTTASRRSSTSPSTCRRRVATASAPPSSTRSPSWSTPPRAAPSGSSPAAAPPRPRPRRCASGCPT